MFYKFDVNGIYCGTSKTEEQYSTSVKPRDKNETATWVWNHAEWVAMPLGWEPLQVDHRFVIPEAPDDLPSEETPPA